MMFFLKKLFKRLSDDEIAVKYIVYQVKHGVRLEDVLKNFGYTK